MNQLARQVSDRFTSCLTDNAQEFLIRYGLFVSTWIGLRRIPVVMWHGPTRPSGQPGTLLVAGHDPWVRYLPNRFFAGEPRRELVGEVSIWALPQMLNRLQTSADLTIARVDRLSARMFFSADYLSVPEWVGTRLSVPDNLDELVRSGGSIRRDMRRIRRHKFQPLITHNREDFETFYHSMYLPFARNRHGELTFVRNPQDLRRRFRRGGILWMHRDGQRVAGMLFERKQQTLDLLVLGTLNGDPALAKEGTIQALYYYIIQLARQLGCTIVDFRGTRPSLSDGVLRYKAKWGVTLYDKADSYHDLLVRWSHFNGVVKEFLSHTPLIFRENRGFSALHAAESQSRRSLWIDGLQQIYLLNASGRQPMVES